MGIHCRSRTNDFRHLHRIFRIHLDESYNQSKKFIYCNFKYDPLLALLRVLLRRRNDRIHMDILVIRIRVDGDYTNEFRGVSIFYDISGYILPNTPENISGYYAFTCGTICILF